MADEKKPKKKLSAKVREAAARIYDRSVYPNSRTDLLDMVNNVPDPRGLPEKIYDFGGERIVAPMVDMVGAGMEKVGMRKGGEVKRRAVKKTSAGSSAKKRTATKSAPPRKADATKSGRK